MNKLPMAVLICLALTACAQKKDNYKSPAGYDLINPVKYKMSAELAEISGITFYKDDKETIYTEQDEEGYIFSFKPRTNELKAVKFGKKGDYEDISIIRDQVIMLRSDGTLFTMPYNEVSAGQVSTVNEWNNLIPKAEYEGMYADENTGNIYILCKSCNQDRKTGQLSGHILELADNGIITYKNDFSIDTKEIASFVNKKNFKFAPSALTKDKQKNKWFILSSVNKLLVITDESWKTEEVFHLDAFLFTQPEGIAFDIDNNLYISNEAGNAQHGTILKFPFNKATR